MAEPMKLVCKVCGKEQEVVESAYQLTGTPKERRWMMLSHMKPGDNGIICGGGLFDDKGKEHDRCLARLIEDIGLEKFKMFNRITIFTPVKGSVP